MKKLIIYVSKTGTTKKCAEKIKENLTDCKIINLEEEEEDINKYDIIIIGTPIRMGMIHKKVKDFLSKNIDVLQAKNVAYFICCASSENYEKYYEQNFPKELLDKAIIYDTFGGEMKIEKQKGFDKFITKMVIKNTDNNIEVKILDENIEKFIKKINEY